MPATSRRLRVHFCIFLFVFLFIYLTLVGITLNQPGEFPRSYNVKVREIVAFSLQKQIEFDSVQIQCDEGLIGGDDGRGRKSDSDWVRVTDSNLFVYSVHLDKRLEPYHYVRVIGVTKGKWNNTVFYCQIHSSTTSDVVVVKANVQPIWFEQWDADTDRDAYYNPVLVSCGIPQGTNGSVVGLTTTPCSVGKDNVFEVEAKGEEKGNVGFTVCVKPMNFPTSGNVRELVQWIEINWILGAGRIEFYVENVGEKMMEVLKWYSNYPKRQIRLKNFHPPPGFSFSPSSTHHQIWQKRRFELIAYNDCFYRNLAITDYIIPLDIDEIIVPRQASTWTQLLNGILSPDNQEKHASFTVQNAYYLREFSVKSYHQQPSTVFFLRDVIRSELSAPGESGKSFVSTKNALTVFNHYALDVLKPGIRKTLDLSSDIVQMNHYKSTCLAVILPECVKYSASPVRVLDTVIFKYKLVFVKKYFQIVAMLKQARIFL